MMDDFEQGELQEQEAANTILRKVKNIAVSQEADENIASNDVAEDVAVIKIRAASEEYASLVSLS